MADSTATSGPEAPRAKDLRAPLDAIDRELVRLLAADGRITNAELATAAGIAPSTAHSRTKALIQRGIVTGFHASVDQAALGQTLQAIIGVTLRPGARAESITSFADAIRDHPQVIQLFFLGGTDDYLVHVAVAGASELREFVVRHLSGQAMVASTRTSVVFDYHRNAVAAPFE